MRKICKCNDVSYVYNQGFITHCSSSQSFHKQPNTGNKTIKKTKSELGGIFSRDPKARRYKNHEGRTIKQRAAIMYAAKDIKYANDRKLKSCFWFRHGMFTDPEQIFQLTKRRVSLQIPRGDNMVPFLWQSIKSFHYASFRSVERLQNMEMANEISWHKRRDP